MYSTSVSKNYLYNASLGNVSGELKSSPAKETVAQNPIFVSPTFKGDEPQPLLPVDTSISQTAAPQQPQPQTQKPSNIRTELINQDEINKYTLLATNLDSNERRNLQLLLKAGILLNNDSNDKSSTLDNLHKMLTTPRMPGINPKTALKETINTIANPFIITQNFGDIPKPYMAQILEKAKINPKTPNDVINKEALNVKHSSACVSASIEFNLAKQMPAEFARFAEGLTSTKGSVDKTIHLKNLTDNTIDSIYLLNTFEIPYEMHDFDKATLTLAPDKNATIRAQIQNNDKDLRERSLIDVLMQSTFMNVGSQQTYDSLTDMRGGKFNWDNKGLIEFEKTFTESIVQDKNKVSVTYQILDENAKLTGYTADFGKVKQNLLDALKMGENVIIGYTQLDDNNQVINGHEITVIGAVKDQNGKLIFICNDTDDNLPNPVAYPEDFIIPKIHHAGLPQKVVEHDIKDEKPWAEALNKYKELKNSTKVA